MIDNNYIQHPLIKSNTVEKRLYQFDIVSKCLNKNSLIILPTSLGKTIIALLLTVNCLEKKKGSVLFLAPTKPLVEQHKNSFLKFLNINPKNIIAITGITPISERVFDFSENKIIIATPQVIKNEFLKKRISFDRIYYIIFDEVHRANGKYAYTYIANSYFKQTNDEHYAIGITASPGSNLEKIKNIANTLNAKNIIYKTENHIDVNKYIHKINIIYKNVKLPQYLE